MSEPYLILHKVRSEPAFDVAIQMQCPICKPVITKLDDESIMGSVGGECDECEGLRYWWIIPTSGHRAYPWWSTLIINLTYDAEFGDDCECSASEISDLVTFPNMPPNWPDHYAANDTKSKEKTFTSQLLDRLGLVKKIDRRI